MKGSCLCGSIEYEISKFETEIVHCHCKTCRKAHSAAFNTTAGVKPESFKWVKGEENLSGFESSPGKVRYFCSKCGTHLIAKKQGAPFWVLRLGSLDDDPKQKPTTSIWMKHHEPWMDFSHDHKVFSEWTDK